MTDALALQHLDPFRGVDLADLEDLCRLSPPVEFGADQRVFSQGGPLDVALLVVRGRLRVTVESEEGEARELGVIAPGEIVGEQALFRPGGRRLATVTSEVPTTCVLLSPDLLQSVMEHPAWAALERHMLGTLVKRIRETEDAMQRAWSPSAGEGDAGAEGALAADAPRSLRDRLRGVFGGRS